MAIDRQRINFEGNERVDIPDFRGMLDAAFADYRYLIKSYIDGQARRTLKRYEQGTHSGLTFKIRKDRSRAFHDLNQEWVYKSAEPSGTIDLALADNSTCYVEVRVDTILDNLQPRAFYDTDIGLTGEEYFDDINVRQRLEEAFQFNTTAFTPGAVPLFTVVTLAGAISTVVASDDPLFKHRSFSLPAATARDTVFDTSIYDLRTFIDFLAAILGEIKGTSQSIQSSAWSSIKLLREYQNVMFLAGTAVQWEGSAGTDTLQWTTDIEIAVAGRASNYLVTASSVTLLDGQCMYVDIPEGPGGPLTPVVSAMTAVPVNPTSVGTSPRILVLFYRKGSRITGAMDMPELDSGEGAVVGRDLPTEIRTRLGITSETTYQAYTSTNIVSLSDTYPDAISALDNELGAILANLPGEEYFTGDGTTTVFSLTTILVSTDNTEKDNIIWVDGRHQNQSETGAVVANRHYRKLSTTQIEFFSAPAIGSVITVRKEGSTYGGPAAPSSGNLWGDPVDASIVPPDLGFNLGGATNRFANGYIDQLYVGKITYREPLADISEIKIKVNASAGTIPAGRTISIYSDGGIYPADSDAITGKNMAGITLEAIAAGLSGRVILFGKNVPGLLTGSGFAPGDKVYIDETGAYTNVATGFTGGDDEIVMIGWADCLAGSMSATVDDLIMNHQIIIAAP
jgi:hypothetical protein